MTSQSPSVAQWRELYAAAAQVHEMAPWTYLYESQMFGVEDPVTGETGYVSIMGNLGEHLAVAVYMGSDGLYGFTRMQESGPDIDIEQALLTPQLQVSWEDRDELDKMDRDIIKKLSLKFRGHGVWPQFRSYRPCFFPWYLEAEEARFLTIALEQVLNVAPRLKDNPKLLPPPRTKKLLCRTSEGIGANRTWADEVRPFPLVQSHQLNISISDDLLEALKMLKSDGTMQVDAFLLPAPVREGSDRPFFPHMVLVVDSNSGAILGTEMLAPEPDLISVLERLPFTIAVLLEAAGMRPREIQVSRKLLETVLTPLAGELGSKVKYRNRLNKLDEAKLALFAHLDGLI